MTIVNHNQLSYVFARITAQNKENDIAASKARGIQQSRAQSLREPHAL